MATLGTCPISAIGLGVSCAKGNPLKMPYKVVAAVPGFQFDTYDDFLDEDKVKEGIANEYLFPLEAFTDVEDASVDESSVETGSGRTITTRDMKRGFIGYMDMTLKQNELLQSYGSTGWTLIIIDEAGNVDAQTPDGTVVKGYELEKFDPKPMERSLSGDTYSRSKIEIRFAYSEQMDKQVVVAKAEDLTWIAKDVYSPVTQVVASAGTVSTNVITISFNFVDDRSAAKPSTPIRTITSAELLVVNQAGTTVTLDGVTETSTPGIWELDCASDTFTSGTIQLLPTATSLYKSNEFTISA